MSAFTENLIVSPLPDGKTWVLRRKFSFYLGKTEDSETIEVPAGFITDFASVPRIFWLIFPPWGKYGNAAVIHDYLYWVQLNAYPKNRADQIFQQGMDVLGVGKVTTWALYTAVKLFGQLAWNSNRKAKQKGRKKSVEIPAETFEIPKMALKGFLLKK
jgi:hypothetical protein